MRLGGERKMKFDEYYRYVVLGLRSLQMVCIGCFVTGPIWASSDLLLNTVLIGVPVTPLSVLLMLYGGVGAVVNEVLIRFFNRKRRFLEEKQRGE